MDSITESTPMYERGIGIVAAAARDRRFADAYAGIEDLVRGAYGHLSAQQRADVSYCTGLLRSEERQYDRARIAFVHARNDGAHDLPLLLVVGYELTLAGESLDIERLRDPALIRERRIKLRNRLIAARQVQLASDGAHSAGKNTEVAAALAAMVGRVCVDLGDGEDLEQAIEWLRQSLIELKPHHPSRFLIATDIRLARYEAAIMNQDS